MPSDRVRGRRRRTDRGGANRGGDTFAPGTLPTKPIAEYRTIPPLEVLEPTQIDLIHDYSLRVLADAGIEFMLPEALDILEDKGAAVDRSTGIVKFDPSLIEEWIAYAPSEFSFSAADTEKRLTFGTEDIFFGSVASAPNSLNRERERKSGDLESFRELLKISHKLPTCSFMSGYPVEPTDVPANTRHLTCYRDLLTLTDKPFRIYAIGKTRVSDALDMVGIGHGIDRATLCESPRLMTNLNVNSPLKVDAPLLEGSIEMVRNGQIVVVTPVAFAGAMSPITLSGTLIQFNAECLATIAFLQMVQPGAPVMYGTVLSNVDMKSGAPTLGSAEMITGMAATGQLARRYGIPMRGFLGATSNAVDAQATYETMTCLWGNVLAGVHCVFHAHGFLDAGLIASYEKAVLDSDLIAMMQVVSPTVDFSDADEALEAICSVGPGGHYLGSSHTMARYKTAFHTPMLSDWRPYEFWRDDGAPETAERAHAQWRQCLENYVAPDFPPSRHKDLDTFVARRIDEIGQSEI